MLFTRLIHKNERPMLEWIISFPLHVHTCESNWQTTITIRLAWQYKSTATLPLCTAADFYTPFKINELPRYACTVIIFFRALLHILHHGFGSSTCLKDIYIYGRNLSLKLIEPCFYAVVLFLFRTCF